MSAAQTEPGALSPGRSDREILLRLADLVHAVEGEEHVVVLTHDNPDPDALASAAGLARLLEDVVGVRTTVAFGGIVGRAENRALIQELGLDWARIETLDIPGSTAIALVDTQPRAGNNSLPAGRIASVVIDHHPARPDSVSATFADIRPRYGSSCSMMVEYLRAAGIEPSRRLATALFYGIQSETMDLGREASAADVSASVYLYPRSDPAAVSRIRYARVPRSYFRALHRALAAAVLHRGVVVAALDRLDYPDLVAEVADLLLQMSGVEWSVVMGRYRENWVLSLRTRSRDAHAGQLIRDTVGERGSAGGHGSFAGGQIPIGPRDDAEAIALRDEILADLLARLGIDGDEGEPLVDVDPPA